MKNSTLVKGVRSAQIQLSSIALSTPIGSSKQRSRSSERLVTSALVIFGRYIRHTGQDRTQKPWNRRRQ